MVSLAVANSFMHLKIIQRTKSFVTNRIAFDIISVVVILIIM